jgi:TM2 domain-containing membrane protein YozV
MSDTYYIRIRGRVHGPMEIDRLKEMASKGQLSRSHELSEDGKAWRAAATMNELFERQRPVKEPSAVESKKETDTSQISAQKSSPPAPNGTPSISSGTPFVKEWHYAIGTAQMGPVTTPELIELIRHRSLARDNIVWKEGMAQWTQAGYVPELVGAFSVSPSGSNAAYSVPFDQQPKSKVTAIVLALLLGSLGIHHFYLGNTLRGLLMLILLFVFVGVFVNPIIALIETIMIAVATEEDFQRKWTNKGMNF